MFTDTSVWSLALRRDAPPSVPEIGELRRALEAGAVYSTVWFCKNSCRASPNRGPKDRSSATLRHCRFSFPTGTTTFNRQNCVALAGEKVFRRSTRCWQSCVCHGLTMLTTDKDLQHVAAVVPISVWKP